MLGKIILKNCVQKKKNNNNRINIFLESYLMSQQVINLTIKI